MRCTTLFFRLLLSALLFFCCDLLLHCVLFLNSFMAGARCNRWSLQWMFVQLQCANEEEGGFMLCAFRFCLISFSSSWVVVCLLSRSGGGGGAKMMPPVFSRKRAVKCVNVWQVCPVTRLIITVVSDDTSKVTPVCLSVCLSVLTLCWSVIDKVMVSCFLTCSR